MTYNCPECGQEISYGEAICPNCTADVTDVWNNPVKEDDTPKIAPGMGGLDNTPFPPVDDGDVEDSPFPPVNGSSDDSPFPPMEDSSVDSPFPPADSEDEVAEEIPGMGESDAGADFAASPFGSPVEDEVKPFPPESAKAFPPVGDSAPTAAQSKFMFEIPRIGGIIYIDEGHKSFGRHEIQGIATKALPDMNAYSNISRQHFSLVRNGDSVTIEDSGSTNGTYIGTKKITGQGPQPLKDGDRVILPIEEHGQMVQLEMIYKEA